MRQLLLVLLLLATLAPGCRRQPEQTPRAQPASTASAPAPQAASTSEPRSSAPDALALRRDSSSAAPQRSTAAEQPAPAPAAQLLAYERGRPVPARDFRIGPLSVAGDGTEGEPLRVASRLLEGLQRGEVEEELLEPAERERLARSLGASVARGPAPTSHRLGLGVPWRQGELRYPLRLFSGAGSAEGEIYLMRRDDGWFVSDLQVSLAELAQRREPEEQAFVPSAYEHPAPFGGSGGPE